MELLERDGLLAALRAASGSLVFVGGEAGAGKSSLVRAFADSVPVPVRTGWCDALGAPRPLGPVHDIAAGRLRELLDAGADRHVIFAAVADLLATPSVLVLEDVHWADEATLDLLLFLGRRVAGRPGQVVATYRDDETDRSHPLRRVLGDLATGRGVRRLTVPSLSVDAVHRLASGSGLDAAQLHAVTGGNPFFVTEALSSGGGVPATVRDAVLARAARLGPAARRLLDLVAVVPDRMELDLLPDPAGLDAALAAGVLLVEGGAVRFRHELARRAVEAEMPAGRALELNALVLDRLGARADPARLAHHAEAAADTERVLEYAPLAARAATALGAHREAAAQYARALRHAASRPATERAALHELRARACSRSGLIADGLASSRMAVDLWAGDQERQGRAMARQAILLWNAGRGAEAHALAAEAVDQLDEGPALAEALTVLTQLRMLARDVDGAISLGGRAISLSERFPESGSLARALNSVGTAHWLRDAAKAEELLTRSRDVARAAGDDESVAAALCNLGSGAGEMRLYAAADRWLAEAVAWCAERNLDALGQYVTAWTARSQVEQGRWAEATFTLHEAAATRPEQVPARIVLLTTLGRLRTRRGDPDAAAPLEAAWDLARGTGDLQRLWPVAAARAELAWVNGRSFDVREVYGLAVRIGHPWAIGELGAWLGVPAENAAPPYEREQAGDFRGAARLWRDLGCPYEAALAGARDPETRLDALRALQELGAAPAAAVVARRLREAGERRIPRAPRAATRANPAGLTARELEVLRLLPGGLRNADIAARLHISPKTVDHHVSAILAKLGVGSRQEAARWVEPDER